jgi:hypothetical protein
MFDPTKAQSKAEASQRLAEIAKTPRARELFKQLAETYEKRARGELTAELIEQMEAAPSLVPVAPLASAVPDAPAAQEIEMPLVPDTPLVSETTLVPEMPPESAVEVVAEATLVPETPSTPPVPVTESDHFLAVLRAFRDEAARGS